MKVTASSRLKVNLSVYYVTDSDPSTYWMSCFEDNQWVLIDFEKQELPEPEKHENEIDPILMRPVENLA